MADHQTTLIINHKLYYRYGTTRIAGYALTDNSINAQKAAAAAAIDGHDQAKYPGRPIAYTILTTESGYLPPTPEKAAKKP